MNTRDDVIEPGKTIGILGGGQLGRMFAIAARRMGYRVHALDPAPDCPTGQVADVEWSAPYDDVATALQFAAAVDVVTFEFENIPYETLQRVAEVVPVHPAPLVLDTTRHRLREKTFLQTHGFPTAPFRAIPSHSELAQAVSQLGLPCILKTATFGYDGKGQTRINDVSEIDGAWEALARSSVGAPFGVLEGFVPFTLELSVIVARTRKGAVSAFDVAENHHEHHILDVTVVPAQVSDAVKRAAVDLSVSVAKSLDLVGVLAVELFWISDGSATGKLIVNELAPRPHNSGHFSIDACVTSQFEQQLRAVCGLPLGDVELVRPVAMANLLGDLWAGGEPHWSAALAFPDVKLHLYGKSEARPGRKMGHLTATASDAASARQRVEAARRALLTRA
ncbi:MAG TPA: 5-(carboxyamino)imidazole ribonucleotide synthase [Myxococcota bacterium]|jgi:5-(carboxyamino)imidazole ribonucleotide synthase